MKKVLCFGDSNTYGYIPASGARYHSTVRWTGVLAELLGEEYQVTEAGCNNRTAFTESYDGVEQTGHKILPEYLQPDLSTIILAAGINDLQRFYNTDEEQIEKGIEKLIDIAQSNSPLAQIIVAAPSVLTEDVLKGSFSFQFDKTSIEKSRKIGSIYEKSAKRKNCKFIDLSEIADVSALDGLHYTPDAHKKIAQEIFNLV